MDLKQDFNNWRSSKVDELQLPDHPFIDVCLDEAIDCILKTTINGIEFQKYYPHQKQMKLILEDWKSNVTALLKDAGENSNIHFRGVPVPSGNNAVELRGAFLQYIDLF